MQKNNLVTAINKNVRSSPRKISLVLDYIRGKKVDVAIRDLEFTRKRIALDVGKTVKSAVSNAENNHQFDKLMQQIHYSLVCDLRWFVLTYINVVNIRAILA